MSGRTFCCDGTGRDMLVRGYRKVHGSDRGGPAGVLHGKGAGSSAARSGELVAVRRVKVCSKVTCVVPELSRGVSTMRTVTLSPSKVRCEKPQVRPRDQSVSSCGLALSC